MKHRNPVRSSLWLAGCSLGATVFAQAAAQGVSDQPPGDGSAVLTEIIVTASKRLTVELDVPVSMAVVTGASIEERGLTNLSDLAATVPGLNIGTAQPTDAVFMRGVGSGTDRGFEQSVAMFLDGVYLPRSRQYRAAFLDLASVEVLRGPQALLYGLNATAGTIIVSTATSRPGDQPFVNVTGEYELEYGRTAGEIVAGGGVGERLGLRLAARYANADDGYYFNTTTGKHEGGNEETFLRGTAVFEATDDLTITGKLTYLDYSQDGGAGECFTHPLSPLSTTAVGQCDGVLDFRRQTGGLELLSHATGDRRTYFDQELLIGSATFDYRIGDNTLTAVFGYSDTSFETAFDVANLGIPLFTNAHFEDHEQFNTEIRFASDDSRPFSYIVGVYYGDQDLHQEIPTTSTLALPSVLALPGSDSTTKTISPFVAATYKFTDTLKLTAGLRYSKEEKDTTRFLTGCDRLIPGPGFQTHTNGGPTANCGASFPDQPGSLRLNTFESDNFMPEATLSWEYADKSTAYLKVGKSVKSGGHALGSSVATFDALTYDDETAQTVEVGLKSRFFDDRVFFRAAAFFTKYEDLQVNSFVITGGNVVGAITNAGASESKGVEFDIDFAATDWLTLGLSHAFLNSEYTDYENGSCGVGQTPDSPLGGCIKTGQDTPFAPSYSGAAYADFDVPVSTRLNLIGGINFSYSDRYFAENTLDPFVAQGSFTRVDARIGVAVNEGAFSVSLIGKNLTDEKILGASQSIGIEGLGHLNPPRTVMLLVKAGF